MVKWMAEFALLSNQCMQKVAISTEEAQIKSLELIAKSHFNFLSALQTSH